MSRAGQRWPRWRDGTGSGPAPFDPMPAGARRLSMSPAMPKRSGQITHVVFPEVSSRVIVLHGLSIVAQTWRLVAVRSGRPGAVTCKAHWRMMAGQHERGEEAGYCHHAHAGRNRSGEPRSWGQGRQADPVAARASIGTSSQLRDMPSGQTPDACRLRHAPSPRVSGCGRRADGRGIPSVRDG